jgi:hypothetical protein
MTEADWRAVARVLRAIHQRRSAEADWMALARVLHLINQRRIADKTARRNHQRDHQVHSPEELAGGSGTSAGAGAAAATGSFGAS